MKKILLFLISVFCFACGESEEKKNDVSYALSQINEEDKKVLEELFRSLFIQGPFSYTLLDKKPMGTIDYSFNFAFNVTPSKFHTRNALIAYKGMKVWEKYKHLFPSKNFYFFVYSHQQANDYVFGFTLLSKPKVLEIIKKNISFFKDFANHSSETPEQVLEMLCANKFYKFDTEKDEKYHKTLGLLLGYSKESVEAFCRIQVLSQILTGLPYDTSLLVNRERYLDIIKNTKKLDKELLNNSPHGNINKSAIEEFDYLLNHMKFVKTTSDPNPLFPIIYPGYMSLENDQDTEKMKVSYDEIKQKLVDIYSSENFLEVVLSLLTS